MNQQGKALLTVFVASFFAFGALAIVGPTLSGCSGGGTSSSYVATEAPAPFTPSDINIKAKKLVDQLVAQGSIIKIEKELRDFYVVPEQWEYLNIEQKEELAATFAVYCEAYCDDSHYKDATIYDGRSGKKLASMTDHWGFKMEN